MSSMAGRPCSICSHPQRSEIDRQLIAGISVHKIAGNFNVTHQSLRRHRDAHVSRSVVAAAARERHEAADQYDDNLLSEVRTLQKKVEGLGAAAYRNGDIRGAISAVTNAAKMVELRAKLDGQIAASTTVNVLVSAEFRTIQVAILGALESHPEAKRAVIEALDKIG